MKILETDCLVIGTGLAGITTALRASKNGAKTILITRSAKPEITSTYYAQGGIMFTQEEDSPQKLKRDIIAAGDNICDEKAIDFLIEWGPRFVKSILMDEVGIEFDKDSDGKLDLTEEGGHSIPRIVHVGDYTGKTIQQQFLNYLAEKTDVKIITKATALDLLTLSHHSKEPSDIYREPTCLGAYIYDQKEGNVFAIRAKETVLATGGLGQIYLHTSNPDGARGDGYTMANRAGAKLLNMEYIQFHPTTLYSKSSNDRFLISERLRGEGAKLLNSKNEEFMHNYHESGTLAPRDVVSRAIHEEMLKYQADYVYLDISFKSAQWIKSRFPQIYRRCLESGVDMTLKPIPVVPAAHYSCGGVFVDNNSKTNILNLRAVGEVACTGVHGANRLASTSLLEDVVWGAKAGDDIGENIKKNHFYLPGVKEWEYENEEVDPALIRQDWLMVKHTMWNYVGLVRNKRRLSRAKNILAELSQEIESFYSKSKLSDSLIGLRNGIRTGNIVLNYASKNRVSRGCHFIQE